MTLQIERSSPLFETENLHFLTVRSPALKGRSDITVFTPPGVDQLQNAALVLLLHGVYDSHWSWAFKGGAHRTARELISTGRIRPMVIAMPSDGLVGDGSGYVKRGEIDCEKWIVEDSIDAVRNAFPCVGERSEIFIAGLSMGGYGALRLGAKYAEKFSGISAHSAGTHLAGMQKYVREKLEFAESDEYDVFRWLLKNREILPPFRLDCGRDDEMFAENRLLHERLDEASIPHEFGDLDGAHDWGYWQRNLPASLCFFSSLIGRKETP